MSEHFTVCALYKFVSLPDYQSLQQPMLEKCLALGIKGTLLLAEEGVNGTISGAAESVGRLIDYLESDARFCGIDYKFSEVSEKPFYRMKVKLKREIVTLGVEGIDPNKTVGSYVAPEHWNALISDPEVLVIDTRNDYEVEVGTFEGARNPNTSSFREFPRYVAENCDPEKHRKVAMFCTGGIRCEKASSFMLEQGFDQVFHLQGGILNYLDAVPEDESLWRGDCFVFDNRVTVNHQLREGDYDQCHACRRPITEQDKQSAHFIEGVSCDRCYAYSSEERKARFAERQKQIALAKQRNEQHIGAPPPSRQANKKV